MGYPRVPHSRSTVVLLICILLLTSFDLPIVSATRACDDRRNDPNALLQIYNTEGKFIGDYEFNYVSYWCVAENVLLRYSDSQLLLQTNDTTFSVFDVNTLDSDKDMSLVQNYRTMFSGYREIALINNSILYWQNGPAPNYVLHELTTSKVTAIPLDLDAISENNLTDEYDTLKYDQTWNKPKLIVTANYNNWVAYAYHDSHDLQNDEIYRNFIVHSGNRSVSKTQYVENMVHFVPRIYLLSPNGKTLVLSNQNAYQGFVTHNLFTNKTFVYQPIGSNSFHTYITGISVTNDKIWFVEYDSNQDRRRLRYTQIAGGTAVTVGTLDLQDPVTGLVVIDEYVFLITNAKRFQLTTQIIVGSIVILVILAIIICWKYKRGSKQVIDQSNNLV